MAWTKTSYDLTGISLDLHEKIENMVEEQIKVIDNKFSEIASEANLGNQIYNDAKKIMVDKLYGLIGKL